MSRDELEAVRRCIALFNEAVQGDKERRERFRREFASLVAPDLVWREDPVWPGADTFHGPDAVLSYLEGQLEEVWQEIDTRIDDIRELEEGRFLVLVHFDARTHAGVPAQLDGAQVWAFRDGRVAEVAWYMDRRRALAELGVEP